MYLKVNSRFFVEASFLNQIAFLSSQYNQIIELLNNDHMEEPLYNCCRSRDAMRHCCHIKSGHALLVVKISSGRYKVSKAHCLAI